jgi:hypothetical protein
MLLQDGKQLQLLKTSLSWSTIVDNNFVKHALSLRSLQILDDLSPENRKIRKSGSC